MNAADIPLLIQLLDRVGLFPGELLPEMVGDSLDLPDSEEKWLVYETENLKGLAYFAPEKMTEGTWNLYLIAVDPDVQAKGVGASLMNYVEDWLREYGARLLIVETSDLPEFELTRKFYDGLGYNREARIREFYDEGDGKIIFWKKLK